MDLVLLLQHVEGDLWKWGKHGWSDGNGNGNGDGDGGKIFFLGLETLISSNQSA